MINKKFTFGIKLSETLKPNNTKDFNAVGKKAKLLKSFLQ